MSFADFVFKRCSQGASFFRKVPFSNELSAYELGSVHFGDDLFRPVRFIFKLVFGETILGEVNDSGTSGASAHLAGFSWIVKPDVSLLGVFD